MRLTRFSRPTRRTVSLQSVGNLWAPTASDIEGPTDLDWVSLCFETEISRCALDSCMAQERSNCLQIASAFQNVESLRPAKRLYAVIRGIESRLDDPELQQAVQLPLTHRMRARNATARKYIIGALFAGRSDPFLK